MVLSSLAPFPYPFFLCLEFIFLFFFLNLPCRSHPPPFFCFPRTTLVIGLCPFPTNLLVIIGSLFFRLATIFGIFHFLPVSSPWGFFPFSVHPHLGRFFPRKISYHPLEVQVCRRFQFQILGLAHHNIPVIRFVPSVKSQGSPFSNPLLLFFHLLKPHVTFGLSKIYRWISLQHKTPPLPPCRIPHSWDLFKPSYIF